MILNYFAIPGMKVPITNNRVHQLVLAVSLALNINPKKLISKSRKRELVNARGLCYIILRERDPSLSLYDIGRCFRRDHSTVINGIREVGKELSYNTDLQKSLATIKAQLP